jgi:hypothetical protein
VSCWGTVQAPLCRQSRETILSTRRWRPGPVEGSMPSRAIRCLKPLLLSYRRVVVSFPLAGVEPGRAAVTRRERRDGIARTSGCRPGPVMHVGTADAR